MADHGWRCLLPYSSQVTATEETCGSVLNAVEELQSTAAVLRAHVLEKRTSISPFVLVIDEKTLDAVTVSKELSADLVFTSQAAKSVVCIVTTHTSCAAC